MADALHLLTRMLLLLVGGHYVDDFNGVEYAEHSDSAFHAFSEFFHVLGFRVKDSKAQPPASRHVLQGVEVHVQQDGVELSPTPRRVAKLRHATAQALESNSLTPPEAGRLAGRLSFLTQAVFGTVGRSALQPVYARSHNTQTDDDQSLSAIRPVRPGSHAERHQAEVPAQRGFSGAAGRDLRGRLRQDRGTTA